MCGKHLGNTWERYGLTASNVSNRSTHFECEVLQMVLPEAVHEPLSQRIFLSEEMKIWLRGYVGSKSFPNLTREMALLNVISSTPRPTDPTMTIGDQMVAGLKLHDREPEELVTVLERKFQGFFDDLPRRDKSAPASIVQKKSFFASYSRARFNDGLARYGKPNLRADGVEADVVEVE